MAAPRAAREDGERVTDEVEGERIFVVGGKIVERRDAMRGV